MNGPQDVGGMTSFGPVAPERDESVFHADWERRVMAITVAMGATGAWNIDAVRHSRESLPPAQYWSLSYYEIWFEGLLRLIQQRGLASRAELGEGRMKSPPANVPNVLKAGMVRNALARGWPADRPVRSPARFSVGDWVKARNVHASGHTRLPFYVRGRVGQVARVHGTYVFPDSSAHGIGEDPHWLYNIRFSANELWGGDSWGHVHIDLWEPYLARAA